jgi:hypothetical protein
VGFRPVEKALFLTTSERARFTDLAVRFRTMISDQVTPKEQERELKKATVTATTNPSVTDPHHKAAMETLDQETGDRMSKVDSPLRRNPEQATLSARSGRRTKNYKKLMPERRRLHHHPATATAARRRWWSLSARRTRTNFLAPQRFPPTTPVRQEHPPAMATATRRR